MGPASEDDLAEMARQVVDANHFMTLGTSEPDGRPRLSPVYFTHAGYRDFYWVSSPTAHHSVNLAARPAVAVVIFDSTALPGQGRAV
jgi:nitroimidazol reductase NimA-like FMN-containing flavoprotein (pyridoxamine 5'-phosphate oxidase superfamily)